MKAACGTREMAMTGAHGAAQHRPSAATSISVVDDWPVWGPIMVEHVGKAKWRLLPASHPI